MVAFCICFASFLRAIARGLLIPHSARFLSASLRENVFFRLPRIPYTAQPLRVPVLSPMRFVFTPIPLAMESHRLATGVPSGCFSW